MRGLLSSFDPETHVWCVYALSAAEAIIHLQMLDNCFGMQHYQVAM